jgi:hypothetical protein
MDNTTENINHRRPLPKLVARIKELGTYQKIVAEQAQVNYFYLNMAINGKYILSEAERRRIAVVLETPESELF